MASKLYISSYEDLNEYERQHNRISYARLCNRVFSDMILCNNIDKVDPTIFDNVVVGSLYDTDTEQYAEIYQYYLVTLKHDIDYIKENYKDNIILTYSDLLDLFVLCVSHFGTSWDYVLTDIEPTTEL